jgi:hypothetical protein
MVDFVITVSFTKHKLWTGGDTPVSATEGPALSSGAIVSIVVASLFIILIFIDLSCYLVNQTGLLKMICEKTCGSKRSDEDAKLGRWVRLPLYSLNRLHLLLCFEVILICSVTSMLASVYSIYRVFQNSHYPPMEIMKLQLLVNNVLVCASQFSWWTIIHRHVRCENQHSITVVMEASAFWVASLSSSVELPWWWWLVCLPLDPKVMGSNLVEVMDFYGWYKSAAHLRSSDGK